MVFISIVIYLPIFIMNLNEKDNIRTSSNTTNASTIFITGK